MRRLLLATLAASCLAVPAAAPAVSISGILVYSTDDFGNPNGWDPVNERYVHGQLWRTMLAGAWYGLGVLEGLPPQSFAGQPLNAPDFSVEIPLMEGENDFTLLGEPGPLTETDQYDRFALNLYFDGMLDSPGISVLFPRNAARAGSPPTLNRSEHMYALSLAEVQAAPQTSYSDGVDTVAVSAVSFLPPQSIRADVDMVSPEAPLPNGSSDWVGVLKLMVEGSSGGVPLASAPAAFGVQPGQALVGPDMLGTPQGNTVSQDLGMRGQATPGWAEAASTGTPVQDPTGASALTATPERTGTSPVPAGTATPVAPRTGSPTTARNITPTPQATLVATVGSAASRSTTPNSARVPTTPTLHPASNNASP
ncbi:MAG: hypothetical protein ABSA52_15645 [Candidatus Binatia bacterium]|jgi:hypothetical protein